MNIIKQRREKKSLTQDELAQAIGQNGGSALISKWESGKHVPSFANSKKLANVLGGEAHEYRTSKHQEN